MQSDMGAFLKFKRQELGITQTALARMLSIRQATISEYERGMVDLPLSKAIKIAHLLDIDLNYLGWIYEQDSKVFKRRFW